MDLIDADGIPTREMFVFLKYNQTVDKVKSLPESEEKMYAEFCHKWSDLISNLNSGVSAASTLGSLLAMFGFKRHYCSICGLPILGKFSKIGSKITCEPCYQSLKIIQQIENLDESKKPEKRIQNIKSLNDKKPRSKNNA